MSRLWIIIFLINCIVHSQKTNVTNFQYTSNTTTDSIKVVIKGMLEAISNNDSTQAAKFVIRDGHVMRVSKKLGKTIIDFRSNNTWIEETGRRKINVYERMWNPIILYRGDLAFAWTTYDIHIKDKFSHCGAETFNLVRIDNKWLVSDWAYTVEPTNCEDGPIDPYINKLR